MQYIHHREDKIIMYLQLLSRITQDIYHREEEEESSTAQPDYAGRTAKGLETGIINCSAGLCRTYITEKKNMYLQLLSRIMKDINHREEEEESSTARPDYVGHNTQKEKEVSSTVRQDYAGHTLQRRGRGIVISSSAGLYEG